MGHIYRSIHREKYIKGKYIQDEYIQGAYIQGSIYIYIYIYIYIWVVYTGESIYGVGTVYKG
jgi:hypothetical protein